MRNPDEKGPIRRKSRFARNAAILIAACSLIPALPVIGNLHWTLHHTIYEPISKIGGLRSTCTDETQCEAYRQVWLTSTRRKVKMDVEARCMEAAALKVGSPVPIGIYTGTIFGISWRHRESPHATAWNICRAAGLTRPDGTPQVVPQRQTRED